ncbi:MAG TPA: class I adenylate-forming enzyme family protein [Acidimicrobiia bacterium]|nr:class I adenylate-forming enzyme family protein [Acidimicrobiia bacterium]
MSSDPAAAWTSAEFVRAVASAYGDDDAIELGDHHLTFRELDDRSSALARGLLDRGVGKGSRVGFIAGNGPEWAIWWFAISRMGAVAVPLSTFLRSAELVRFVRQADLHALVVQRTFLGQDLVARVAEAIPELAEAAPPDSELAVARVPFLRWIASNGDDLPGWATDLAVVERGGVRYGPDFLAEVESEVHPEDPATEIYTSGITALPKGVTHTHRALMTKGHYHSAVTPFERGSRQLVRAPLFWVGGLMMFLLPGLECGALLECTESTSSGSRGAFGSVLPRDELAARPRRGVTWALGMTETLGPYSMGNEVRVEGYPLCPPLDAFAPGFDVKVVDEEGVTVGDGETGEIVVRGPTLTVGLHKVRREDAFDADGFYRTGDLGEVHGSRILFVGRKDDMIKTSGANVAPAEVEMELQDLDGVDNAYVVPLPDAKRGRMVAAAIVPEAGAHPDPDALRAELRTRLSSYKVPRVIVLIERDEVPMTASNKVHKKLIADLVVAKVAAGEGAA